jgi:hypothetical protein
MPQLRENARRRVVRQLRQLVERQPRRALPCAYHYVANHFALFPELHRLCFCVATIRPPHRHCLPPWEFLLSASRNSLQSFELSRLAHAAYKMNGRKSSERVQAEKSAEDLRIF